jgi:hypothetical protein
MADDKMKGDQDFKNHSNNSTTSPLQAKPASGLVSNPSNPEFSILTAF